MPIWNFLVHPETFLCKVTDYKMVPMYQLKDN